MRASIIISLIGSIATASLISSLSTASQSTEGITLDSEPILGTCRNIQGDSSDEWLMWACCKNPDGNWKRTRLDLAQCLKNSNGILDPEWGGDASSSCKDCRFHGHSLGCVCEKEGEEKMTWIHLDSFVDNRKGLLSCFGNVDKKGTDFGPCK